MHTPCHFDGGPKKEVPDLKKNGPARLSQSRDHESQNLCLCSPVNSKSFNDVRHALRAPSLFAWRLNARFVQSGCDCAQ